MDNVLIVVEDLEAAKAFFAELGMELEGETQLEGPWVDRTVGLDGVRADIAMMRTPDGHGRVELTKFHTPPAVRAEPESAPANALGIRRIMFAVDDVDDVVARLRTTVPSSSAGSRSTRTSTGSASCAALRASSSEWPSSSADPPACAGARCGDKHLGNWLSVRYDAAMPTADAPQLDRAFHALADESRRAMVVRLSRGAASVSELPHRWRCRCRP